LVNFTLRLGMLVEPRRPWRIITSRRHSTVWDGTDTVLEFNFQAFGIDATECLTLARKTELEPGKYLKTYRAARPTYLKVDHRPPADLRSR
jgi:hypothetical protein